MHLPVWYRAAGEVDWHGGMTENISVSGVTIRADERTVPAEMVTVVISLPSTATESSSACLVGRGRVTRLLASSSFAVEVTHYRLHRRDSAHHEVAH